MEYKLPKKFKDKWVNALRSGEYKQTDGILFGDCGYCAIGVALHSVGKISNDDLFNQAVVTECMIDDYNLPFIYEDDQILDEVTELNDNAGYTFDEIAEWIESNIKGT